MKDIARDLGVSVVTVSSRRGLRVPQTILLPPLLVARESTRR